MNSISGPGTLPCYHIDTTSKTAKFGRCSYSDLLKLQAQRAEEERTPAIGSEKLTDQQLQELASKYDPSHMTQPEYNRFINDLAGKGILGRSELYDIGLDRVVLRPGHFSQGSFVPALSFGGQSVQTLADAKGDAVYWTSLMAQRSANRFSADPVQSNALQKINGILQQMKLKRQNNF